MSRKALVVGIDDYPGCPLNGCVNDAEEIKNLLETNGDGSPNFEVKFAPNIQTKDELLDLLNALFCEGDSDISLFYFSGHGTDEVTGKIVTPDFKGDNLVASGVLMEAYSVEDDGKGICFCVYVYNIQPGIEIDYRTGESHEI